MAGRLTADDGCVPQPMLARSLTRFGPSIRAGLAGRVLRELQDRLYKELTRKVLMRNAPSEMSLRVDKAKFALDEQIVQDAKINPCLVKKRP